MPTLYNPIKTSLIVLWFLLTACLVGLFAIQHQLPREMQDLALAEPQHTYYLIGLGLSLVFLVAASYQLWYLKSLGRVYLLVSLIGIIVSNYFSAYRVDYYGMGFLDNLIYLALGAFTALVYSNPQNQLFKNNRCNLATRENLLLLSVFAVLSYLNAQDFATPVPDTITNYLSAFALQQKDIKKIFFVVSFGYLVNALLLNSGIRLAKYLFITLTTLFIMGDLFAVTSTEGGMYAILHGINTSLTGALLVVIFCSPLTKFFTALKSERKVFSQDNKNIIIEALLKIKKYFLVRLISQLLLMAAIGSFVFAVLFLATHIWALAPYMTSLYSLCIFLLVFFIWYLVIRFLSLGYLMQAINRIKNRPVTLSQMASFIKNPFKLALLYLITLIICRLPGASILGVFLLFADVLILEKNMGLFEAIQTSFRIVKNNSLSIAGFIGFSFLLVFVSLYLVNLIPIELSVVYGLAFIVFSVPFLTNIYAILYVKYTENETKDDVAKAVLPNNLK